MTVCKYAVLRITDRIWHLAVYSPSTRVFTSSTEQHFAGVEIEPSFQGSSSRTTSRRCWYAQWTSGTPPSTRLCFKTGLTRNKSLFNRGGIAEYLHAQTDRLDNVHTAGERSPQSIVVCTLVLMQNNPVDVDLLSPRASALKTTLRHLGRLIRLQVLESTRAWSTLAGLYLSLHPLKTITDPCTSLQVVWAVCQPDRSHKLQPCLTQLPGMSNIIKRCRLAFFGPAC
jgi:hypothetical protein